MTPTSARCLRGIEINDKVAMMYLPQKTIEALTGCKRPSAQERYLRRMGFIVVGRNAKNEVIALEDHPKAKTDKVRLEL